MFSNFLFCCGNQQVKNQHLITATLYDDNTDHSTERGHLQITPIQPPISVLGINPAEIRDEDEVNQVASIIMGKTPSDIDLMGLCKSIHMKSTEKQF